MIPALQALEKLRDGNERFVADVRSHATLASRSHRGELADGQEPFAIILGCSDSRVPAEIVFDQGLGDLFVIRVAGNIVAPSQIGSVEFAANVRVSASQLRHGSELLESLIEREGLLVVGAEYSLESGVVEFFDGVPVGAPT
jgi:carbonic anhydrase